jgi:phosphoribosylanthranilate isomerase
VTVDRSAGEVAAWVEACGFLAIQAHGDESPELCASYGVPVVKALATRPGFRAEDAAPYRGFPILLDGHARGRRGGTGRPADWRVARELVDGGVRLLLAGGLGPGRLREAVEAVRPLAVDLNSGVEREPGVKDPRRIAAALRALDGLERRAPEERPW